MKAMKAGHLTFLLILTASLTLFANEAQEAPDSMEPREKFNQGVRLAKEGKPQEALEIWYQVLDRLDSKALPRALYMVAKAQFELERLPETWYFLTRHIAASKTRDSEAATWLGDLEEELKLKGYHKLELSCRQPDTRLELISPALPLDCPVQWWFLPGTTIIPASAPGFLSHDYGLVLAKDNHSPMRTINLVPRKTSKKIPLAQGPATIHSSGEVPQEKRPEPPSHISRTPEWVLAGSSLVLGAAGGLVYYLAHSRNDTLFSRYNNGTYGSADFAHGLYMDAYRDEVRPKENLSYGLWGLGATTLAASIVTWLVRNPDETAKQSIPKNPSSPR